MAGRPVVSWQRGQSCFGHEVDDLEALGLEFTENGRQCFCCHGMDVVEQNDAFATLCEFAHDPVHDRIGRSREVIHRVNIDREDGDASGAQVGNDALGVA